MKQKTHMAKNILLWVDDKPSERKSRIGRLCKVLGLIPQDICLNTQEGGSWFETLRNFEDESVALVIVDQYLSNKSTIEPFSAGSSLCSVLREKFIDVPIVGISAAARADIPESLLDEYTAFYELEWLLDASEELKAMLKGFESIREMGKKQKRCSMLKLLNAPPICSDYLNKIIPLEFMSPDLTRKSISFYKWCRDVLFCFQGVLLDSAAIAASIGLEESSFLKEVSGELECCEYAGIFARKDRKFYWRDVAYQRLALLANDTGDIKLSHYGEILCGGTKCLATCPICHKKYTEVLAHEENRLTGSRRRAAHYRCVVEANLPRPALFDPVYILKGGA